VHVEPDAMYVANLAGNAYRTRDAETAREPGPEYLTSFASDGSTLWAGSSRHGVFRRVVESAGAGEWLPVPTEGLPDLHTPLVATVGDTLFTATDRDGIYRYLAAEQRWIAVNEALTSRAVQCLDAAGDTLFAGTLEGLFRLDGEAWTPVNGGADPLAICAVTGGQSSVYTGTWCGGVYRADDRGESWEALPRDGLDE
jgi:hypothetical protein